MKNKIIKSLIFLAIISFIAMPFFAHAQKKISQLPQLTTLPDSNDIMPIVNDATTKQVKVSVLKDYFNAGGSCCTGSPNKLAYYNSNNSLTFSPLNFVNDTAFKAISHSNSIILFDGGQDNINGITIGYRKGNTFDSVSIIGADSMGISFAFNNGTGTKAYLFPNTIDSVGKALGITSFLSSNILQLGWVEPEIKSVKVVFDSTQIKTCGTNPLIVIPAPGAGKAIMMLSAWQVWQCDTVNPTNYAPDSNAVYTGLAFLPVANDLYAWNNQLTSSACGYYPEYSYFNYENQYFRNPNNAPLYYTTESGQNFTRGKGNVTVFLTYKIIDL